MFSQAREVKMQEFTTSILCSIIIPTIGRSTLARAIESALDQSGIPDECVEVVIVNDGVSSLSLPSHLTDHPRLRLISTHQVGLCSACNAGALLATGRYLKILHDDDWLLPNCVYDLVSVAVAREYGWVTGGIRLVDDSNQLIRELPAGHLQGNLMWFFLVGEAIHISSVILERDLFNAIGGFDASIKISEDRDLGWRMSMRSTFGATNSMVAVIRQSGGSYSAFDFRTSRHFSNMIRERILESQDAIGLVIDETRRASHSRGRVTRSVLASILANLKCGDYRKTFRRIYLAVKINAFSLPDSPYLMGLFNRTR